MKHFGLIITLLFFTVAATAQIVNIEERRITGTNDTTHWYGSLRLAANVNKVKDQVLQFNSTGHVQYKNGRSLTLLLLDANFLRAGNKDFNQSAFAHLRYNFDLTRPLVAEAYLQAQFNKLLLIELRALAGAGLRFRLFKSQDGNQRIYGGLAYLIEQNKFLEGIPAKTWHRASAYLSFTFRPWPDVKLVNTTYYQPTLLRFSKPRISTEWRLDMPLGKKLSFFSDFRFSVDKSLPVEAPGTVYVWMNGVGVRF